MPHRPERHNEAPDDLADDLPVEAPELPAAFHRDRREHGGAPQRLNDDQLAELTEEERVAAGLDDYDPDEVPDATDDSDDDIRDAPEYQAEEAEVRRQAAEGELGGHAERGAFPPTRYDDA